MSVLLVWLYGLAAWGALCNVPAWTGLIERWFTDPRDDDGRHLPLRYLMARVGLLLASVGIFFGSAVRCSTFLMYPERAALPLYIVVPGLRVGLASWPEPFLATFTLPGWSQVTWVVCLVVSEVMFLATAALAGRVKGRRPWWLAFYVLGAVAWTVMAVRL